MKNELPKMGKANWFLVALYAVVGLVFMVKGALDHDLLLMVAGLVFCERSDTVIIEAKLDELRRKM